MDIQLLLLVMVAGLLSVGFLLVFLVAIASNALRCSRASKSE